VRRLIRVTQLRRSRPDLGAAAVETVFVALVVLLPLLEVLVGLGEVQRASLATSAAAREAVRAFARPAAARAVAEVVSGHGLDPGAASISVEGDLTRGAMVRVSVAYPVPLVGWPLQRPTITVTGRSNGRVDPYRSL
jgi:Flp pilus assembly protein TadG